MLGGSSATSLSATTTAPRHGFETHITVKGSLGFVAVQALDSHGHVLVTSTPIPSG